MNLFKSLTLLLFLFSHAAYSQESPELFIDAIEGVQESTGGDLDHFTLDGLMKEYGIPGVSIAVIKDYEVHWAKGYGVADVETGALVDEHTVFQAASISKPVAAMAVMKAVQEGYFALDDDINSILTSWKLPESEFTAEQSVTPRMLTSHTSGLGDGFGFPGYKPDAPVPTLVQIMEGDDPSNVGKVFMERAPMKAIKYSGGGVTMMQLALSDALGKPFEEIAQEYVLGPVGMSDSAFDQPISEERDQNAARAHNAAGRSMGVKWHVYPEQAAAGLWTTPTDLAKFAIEVQKTLKGDSPNVIDRSHMLEMVTPVGVGDFAVGFEIEKRGQGWYFQHGGANWGFKCVLVAHKAKGYGMAVMTNGIRGHFIMTEILNRVSRAYEWDIHDERVPR